MKVRLIPAAGTLGRAALVAAAMVAASDARLGADPQPSAGATGGGGATSFTAFRLIGDGNIFNQNRVARTSAGLPRDMVETISLVGTMQSESGLFAFFDSPDENYRKAVHEGDTIAQFTVKHISPDRVELARDSGPVSLAVGEQLSRPTGGDWTAAAPAAPNPAAAEPAEQTVPGDESAVLKRLMEKRQQQLNK
jgi:hypothetical protein